MISAVIPTLDRHEDLRETLAALDGGTHRPDEILVVGSKTHPLPSGIVARTLLTEHPSAAGQRNTGADSANGDFLLFLDDDITVAPDCLEKLVTALTDNPQLAGVAGQMEGSSHPVPSPLLSAYYRLQAGYSHTHYGAQVFGPAITTFPCYAEAGEELISAGWLNSACVLYRKEVFSAHRFPDFDGYSPFEDVHLSARIAKSHELAFHRSACYTHRGEAGTSHSFKSGQQFITNLRSTAREALQLSPSELAPKLLLHKIFILAHLARTRPSGWLQHSAGVLSA